MKNAMLVAVLLALNSCVFVATLDLANHNQRDARKAEARIVAQLKSERDSVCQFERGRPETARHDSVSRLYRCEGR